MARLNPYLTFNGNCKEAMTFYQSILGGELTIMIAGESPAADMMPPQFHKDVLHSALKTEEFEIMATDMVPQQLVDGNSVHLCLLCKNEAETYSLFEKLSEDGIIAQPIHEMFFGLIGSLTDKFGKNWLLECDRLQGNNTEKTTSNTEAMLK